MRWLRRRKLAAESCTLTIDNSVEGRYATMMPSFILEIDGTVSTADVEEIRRSLVASARPQRPKAPEDKQAVDDGDGRIE